MGRQLKTVLKQIKAKERFPNLDLDYVVVYGVKGNQVAYTIRYVDENGQQLSEDTVFNGIFLADYNSGKGILSLGYEEVIVIGCGIDIRPLTSSRSSL